MKKQTHPRVIQTRAEMPSSCRGIYDRAMGGKSRKAAIKSFCLQCVGYVRMEITKCTSPQCPLFHYRPIFDERTADNSVEIPDEPMDNDVDEQG
jgi:hypothetical protein